MQHNKFQFQPILQQSNPWQLITHTEARTIINRDNSKYEQESHSSTNSSTNLPPIETFYRSPFNDFVEKITHSTNYFMKEAQKLRQLEENVPEVQFEEIKQFFSVITLLQDYQFPDYREHFKTHSQGIIKSPIADIMHLGRFQIFLKYLDLDTKPASSEDKPEIYNYFLESLLSPDFGINENLILIIKNLKFENSKLNFLGVFDQTGYLLTGTVFNQTLFDDPRCRFEYVLKILKKLRGKNHTLILPNELFSLGLVELLQIQHHFKCLVMILQEPGKHCSLIDLPKELIEEPFIHNPIYCYNSFNGIIISKQIFGENILYFIENSSSFFNPESIEGINDQAVDFIQKIHQTIEKLWKVSIWKSFDQNHLTLFLDIILFIYESIMNNSYLLYYSKFMQFSSFKTQLLEHLVSKKKEAWKPRKHTTEEHYPDKMKYCKICRVCKKKTTPLKKTKYRCEACSENLRKDIALCVYPCFREYHLDMEKYNKRKKKIKLESDEEGEKKI